MVSRPSEKSVPEVIRAISGAYKAKEYSPMIKSIKFSNYKNIASDINIEFNFPVSIIVGPNGTNKTSILRALESCPKGKSLSDYWFSTDLDPIPRPVSKSDNPEYTYSYDIPESDKVVGKVRKYMTFKNDRDDYFEPAKRVDNDGYVLLSDSQKRKVEGYRKSEGWKPVAKKVVYIDMRQRVPAYDINMTYGFSEILLEDRNRKKRNRIIRKYGGSINDENKKIINDEYKRIKITMKKSIRDVSGRISEVFKGENIEKNRFYYGKKKFSKNAIKLTGDELAWVRYILGREYREIAILRHSYFELPGVTVQVKVEDKINNNGNSSDGIELEAEPVFHTYSEAYAGSGEYAVIMMVHYIYTAEKGALILMDEPENSLHPESQRRLMEYILCKTLTNKHQFIISSHSMYMSESLPNKARIALSLNSGGFVEPHMSVTHRDAFMGVGAAPQAPVGKVVIKVEDGLAEAMVRHVLFKSDDRSLQDRYIIQRIGSCSYAISTYIPADIDRNASDTLWILDSDCNYHEKDNIISRLEEKLAPNYGYDYYACRVALYYVTDVQGSSGANGYDAVVAYLDALETKSQDMVNRCLEKVNEKVNKFILSKGDAQREREERIKPTLSWLEKYVHYLPGERNPESWVLGQTVGINCYGNRAAKKLMSSHGREIREACKLLPGEEIKSNHILQYEVGLLGDIDMSKFESLRTVLEKCDG